MKKILSIFTATILGVMLVACGSTNTSEKVSVSSTQEVPAQQPETLIAMVQDGQHYLFAFPLTVVAKLYNKGMDVRLMNVNTWGVTYFMTSDPDFKD